MTSVTRSLKPASSQPLPRSVLKLLDEAEQLAGAGLPVQFSQLPSVEILGAAVHACEAALGGADQAHAKRCYARLITAFDAGTKQGEQEMRLRFGVFFDACKDMPSDLWETATASCIQELKWMPKPSEFRDQVKVEFEKRRDRLRRAKATHEAAKAAPVKRGFVAEHPDVRDAALIESWKRAGRPDKVKAVEDRIAARKNSAVS